MNVVNRGTSAITIEHISCKHFGTLRYIRISVIQTGTKAVALRGKAAVRYSQIKIVCRVSRSPLHRKSMSIYTTCTYICQCTIIYSDINTGRVRILDPNQLKHAICCFVLSLDCKIFKRNGFPGSGISDFKSPRFSNSLSSNSFICGTIYTIL